MTLGKHQEKKVIQGKSFIDNTECVNKLYTTGFSMFFYVTKKYELKFISSFNLRHCKEIRRSFPTHFSPYHFICQSQAALILVTVGQR